MKIIKKENINVLENTSKRIVTYLNENDESVNFDGITSFCEISLDQTEQIVFNEKENFNVIIIPLIGAFICNEKVIKPNEILFDIITEKRNYNISQNQLDFGYALIIKTEKLSNFSIKNKIDIGKNNLNSILNIDNNFQIKIGVYSLRTKDYLKYSENKNFLIFALAGAFELNDRLIEAKEMLLIENENELDFEALSDQGLILIIESKTN